MSELTTQQGKEPRSMQPPPRAESAVSEEEWFDLLPVEKKLLGYSLATGVALLVVFIFAFGVFK